MQYFGNKGASSQKSGAGAGASAGAEPVKTQAEIQAEIDAKRNSESIYPTAKWDGTERKVVYRVSFTGPDGEDISLNNFISKGTLISEMKKRGATPEQIKKVREGLKKINPANYKR